MLVNKDTALLTPKILLVPYSAHHVPTYHAWMQSAELQALTASEPLTLEQEYEMQRSWREDADKLTFIACKAPEPSELEAGSEEYDRPEKMIGDVNLFVYPAEDEHEDAEVAVEGVIGEVEIMVAVAEAQGQGNGKAMLLTFLWYVLVELARDSTQIWRKQLLALRVKIDKDNVRSIRLFEGVGFSKVKAEPNYFGEVELRWKIDGEDAGELRRKLAAAATDWRDPRVLSSNETSSK